MSEKAGCFRVSENFDTKVLAERASREMSAMGYDVKLEKTEKGFRVAYEKDIGGMDTFLGRWQNSVAEIENSGGDLKVSFHGHRVADKLIAFVLGGFFWGFPWLFEGIAVHNRRRSEQIFLNVVSVYVSSTKEDD